MDIKKRILHISAGELCNAGIETFIMNAYRCIDRNKFQFHFVKTNSKKGFHDDEFEGLGGKLINVYISDSDITNPSTIKQKYRYFKEINRIMKENGPYDVLHYHQQSWCDIIIILAFINKIPVRISHSHNAYINQKNNLLKRLRINLRRNLLKMFSTYRLGCSKEACISLFGEMSISEKNTIKINNGIDFNVFNKNIYSSIPKIEKCINFIHVGRFTKMKNHMFLIDLFSEINKQNQNTKLTLIGWGELQGEIRNKINTLSLNDKILLLPHETSIPKILSQMDYFIFPSVKGEGLGIVLIEAQAMGVPCFVSSYVPNEADLGLCKFIDLDKGVHYWKDIILDDIESKFFYNKKLSEKAQEYDSNCIAKELEKIYLCKI